MDPITLGSLGVGLIGSIGKMFGRGASNRRLADLASRMPKYQANPLAAQRLGMAQALLNARMPGAAAAEQNIYQTQASQIAGAERASTDPNQLLLAGAAAAGQAGQQFQRLGQMEAQDYQRRYQNLSQAQQEQIAEQQREYEDQVRRYQMQSQIEAAQQENRQNLMGDISNLGFAGAYLGQQGFFGTNPMGRRTGVPPVTPTATTPGAVTPTTSPTSFVSMSQGQYPSSKLNISPFQQIPFSSLLNTPYQQQGGMGYKHPFYKFYQNEMMGDNLYNY